MRFWVGLAFATIGPGAVAAGVSTLWNETVAKEPTTHPDDTMEPGRNAFFMGAVGGGLWTLYCVGKSIRD